MHQALRDGLGHVEDRKELAMRMSPNMHIDTDRKIYHID